MAQKVIIDIVADTQKLTQGVNEASNQVTGLSNGLKGAASAASAAASAFLLKEGVTFLKQGIDEAKEAKQTMREATTTFGEGSDALKKITEDATKFGKEIAVDNDEIIKLATQLGARLPADAKSLSAELVNLAFDVEAFTAGAITADTVTGKLAKALADGEVKATDLQKIVPGLTDAQYKQAEAASKAGDNQKALTIIIDAAQKKYGDAAEKNVTSTQKFDTALADLKEQVGTQVLPIVEKFIDGLTTLLEWFDKQPDSIKKIEIALGILLTAGALTLTFLASMKTSLVTLGIINGTTAGSIGLVTIATNLLKVALAGLGIGLVIAAIVLLVQNWDKVTEAVSKVWEMIKDVIPKAWSKVMEFKDKVVGFVGDIVEAYISLPSKMFNVGKNILEGLWNGMRSMISWLKNKVLDLFEDILPSWAKKALGIKSPSKVFSGIGKNVADGLWKGLQEKQKFLKTNFYDYFGDLIPSWAKQALKIASPSKVFIEIGDNIALGVTKGIQRNKSTVKKASDSLTGVMTTGFGTQNNLSLNGGPLSSLITTNVRPLASKIPTLSNSFQNRQLGFAPVVINVNAAPGTDLYALGRTVNNAVNKYSRISSQYGVKQQL